MPRRKPWRTRADILAAERDEASAREEELRRKLKGTEWQLRWHKQVLAETQAVVLVAAERNTDLELTVDSLTAQLERERAHAAGNCTHAAELNELLTMSQQVTALERRVHDLQQANIARDVAEIVGWSAVDALPTITDRPVLKRGRG